MKLNSITKDLYHHLFRNTMVIQFALLIYFFSDAVIVGNYLGEKAFSVTTLVLPLYYIITATVDMVAIGGSNLFSVESGRGKPKHAGQYFSATLWLALLLGLFLAIVSLLLNNQLALLFGAKGDLIPMTQAYLCTLSLSAPFLLVYTCMDFFVRNDGNTKLAMVANWVFISANMVSCVWFVGYTDLGIAGAGWAVTVGAGCGLLVLVQSLLRKNNNLHFTVHFEVRHMLRVLQVGSSVATKPIYECLSLLVFNNLLMRYHGTEGVVVYTVIFNITALSIFICEGLRDTLQPIICTYYGEKNNHGTRDAMKITLVIGGLLCLCMVLFLELFPELWLFVFGIGAPGLRGLVVEGIRIYAMVIPLVVFNEVMSNYYQFVAQHKLAVVITSLRGAVVLLPCAGIFLVTFGLQGFWLGFVVTECVTAAAILFLARKVATRAGHPCSPLLLLDAQQDECILTFSFVAEPSALVAAISRCERFLTEHAVSAVKMHKILLSLEEIGLNIMEHNRQQKNPLLEVQLELGEKIVLLVRDNCKNFDSTQRNSPAVAGSGFGLKIIRTVSEEFNYLPTVGYNRVILTF